MDINQLNYALFSQIFTLGGKSWVADNLMILGAEYIVYLTFLLIVIFFITGGSKERKAAVLTLFSVVLAIILVKVLHILYFEPRPFVTYPITPLVKHIADAAFPSEHTTIMAIVAFSFAFYRSRKALLLVLLAVWVGLSRIYIGVHYPLDILGGFIMGFIATGIIWQIKNWLKRAYF